MKKIPQLYVTIFVMLLALASCKKNDFPYPPVAQDCDYKTAISNYLYRGQEVFVDSPIFLKHYIENTHQVDYISTRYQGAVGTLEEGQNLFAHYSGLQTFYLTAANDTFVTLNYNAKGKLVTAKGRPDMGSSEIFSGMSDFKFHYTNGKIVFIERRDRNSKQWEPYVKLYYNSDQSNVTKIDYYVYKQVSITATFGYNMNQTAKHQYYADQHSGFPHFFFSFLKYLNAFPELLPKNVLNKWNLHYSEIGDQTFIYANHKFDASGNLISYDITNTAADFPPEPTEHWSIRWDCCRVASPASN